MTRLTFFKCGLVLVALLTNFRGLAQTATYNNGLPCDVEILVEEFDGSCQASNSYTFVIPEGGSYVQSFSPGTFDACIIITKIGSCIMSNIAHLSNGCHGTTQLTSGSVLASCCPGISSTWNASWTPMTTFNIW